VIFSILFLAMQNLLFLEKKEVNNIKQLYKKEEFIKKVIKALYNDIIEAKEIKIKCKKFCTLNLKTTNSLYNHPFVDVEWFVSKKENSLIRTEKYNNKIFADRFFNVKKFKVYLHNNKYLICIFFDKKICFEMVK